MNLDSARVGLTPRVIPLEDVFALSAMEFESRRNDAARFDPLAARRL
jgi:hypothetical protein